MILGRNAGLWVGAAGALLNVLVVVFGVPLTMEGLAAMNAAILALVALVANVADPTTLPTFAASIHAPAVGSGGMTVRSVGSGANVTTSSTISSATPTPTDPTPSVTADPSAASATAGTSGPSAGSPSS